MLGGAQIMGNTVTAPPCHQFKIGWHALFQPQSFTDMMRNDSRWPTGLRALMSSQADADKAAASVAATMLDALINAIDVDPDEIDEVIAMIGIVPNVFEHPEQLLERVPGLPLTTWWQLKEMDLLGMLPAINCNPSFLENLSSLSWWLEQFSGRTSDDPMATRIWMAAAQADSEKGAPPLNVVLDVLNAWHNNESARDQLDEARLASWIRRASPQTQNGSASSVIRNEAKRLRRRPTPDTALALYETPANVMGHSILLRQGMHPVCGNHPNGECPITKPLEAQLRQSYNQSFPAGVMAFAELVDDAVRGLVETESDSDMAILIGAVMQTPASWGHLELLPTYAGQPIPLSTIPSYLAEALPASAVIKWIKLGVMESSYVKLAERINAASPDVAPELVAIATMAWPANPNQAFDMALEAELEGSLTPLTARDVLTYQMAGWRTESLQTWGMSRRALPADRTPPPPQKSNVAIRHDLRTWMERYRVPDEWWDIPTSDGVEESPLEL